MQLRGKNGDGSTALLGNSVPRELGYDPEDGPNISTYLRMITLTHMIVKRHPQRYTPFGV